MRNYFPCLLALLLLPSLHAAEQHGEVKFGGQPVPGAAIIASKGDQRLAAITDLTGKYSFPDLAPGNWTIEIEMPGFEVIKRNVVVSATSAPAADFDLKMLALEQIKATEAKPEPAKSPPVTAATTKGAESKSESKKDEKKAEQKPAAAPPAAPDISEDSQNAADGFLINGSQNNGAASPFAQNAAFGNNRRGPGSLYNGGLGFILDDSVFDARPFSLTGQDTPKQSYASFTGLANFGGPIRIPRLFRNSPNIFAGYQWKRSNQAVADTALVPTIDQRNGILSNGAVIPASQISPQARALLNLYPLPNFSGSSLYNYQVPLVTPTHSDALNTRINQFFSPKNQAYGNFAFQSTRSNTPSLFGFNDTTDSLGINSAANWRHTFGSRIFANFGVQYSRMATLTTPYFSNRSNISGEAGITGNDQTPVNWGPPTLNFSDGITPLTDGIYQHNRNQTFGTSAQALWARSKHNIDFGFDFRRQQFNYLEQSNPRGAFTFNGAATGNDFGDFLTGIPDTSAIAFGNADKYFRESVWDAHINDDFRVSPELTLNFGLRWEYAAPITEKYGRLVNLDIAPGFSAVAPVVGSDPVGSLTGDHYPDSLIRPDRHGFEPRVALAWRPISASSLVVRAGYGVYYNTSVFQNIAIQMAQQAPLSKSLSVSNSAADPLTLANGFVPSPNITQDTFAIDPNFQIGYTQNWNLALQRDLPGSLVMTATYLGIKGTRGMQEFLPNTYPAGAVNPCPTCPTGFAYFASNGDSTRESAQLQLRRRLHNGFTAQLQYTFSKSIDDSSLGGKGQGQAVIAQNWLDLSAERGLSTFDQRHLLNLNLQYTTGMGLGGGTLLSGWRGALFKEWTLGTAVTAGTGLPLTPNILAAVSGTGVTGTIRPDYTGAPLYAAPPGLFLNPAAYTDPAPGEWGNAGRDTITGPYVFTLNATLARTFRLTDRFNLDARMDATNALNHVTFASYVTTITSAQFGTPTSPNQMRSMQMTVRVRF